MQGSTSLLWAGPALQQLLSETDSFSDSVFKSPAVALAMPTSNTQDVIIQKQSALIKFFSKEVSWQSSMEPELGLMQSGY